MNAALGVRLVADFFFPELFLAELFLAEDFLADFEDDFFAELFFFAVAIASPGGFFGRPITPTQCASRVAK
jgi:hypothetical protein